MLLSFWIHRGGFKRQKDENCVEVPLFMDLSIYIEAVMNHQIHQPGKNRRNLEPWDAAGTNKELKGEEKCM